MIELTDDQKKAVAAAQETFSTLKNNTDSLTTTDFCSRNCFLEIPHQYLISQQVNKINN